MSKAQEKQTPLKADGRTQGPAPESLIDVLAPLDALADLLLGEEEVFDGMSGEDDDATGGKAGRAVVTEAKRAAAEERSSQPVSVTVNLGSLGKLFKGATPAAKPPPTKGDDTEGEKE